MKSRTFRVRAALALVVTVALAVTMNDQPAIAAKPVPFAPPKAPAMPSVAVRNVAAGKAAVAHARQAADLPSPVWPAAAGVDVGSAQAASSITIREAKRPAARGLTAAKPSKTHVDVLDQAASRRARVQGLLFRVGRADGRTGTAAVNVAIDYSKFATAYGADWSTRLRLVRLPECALSTPDRKECKGSEVPTTNNTVKRQASADLQFASSQLMALSAAPAGPAGSYGATTLSPSGAWSSGSSSGNFSWSFPMRMPSSLGGPAPSVELGYSSQSVDGRMLATNNQPSEVGEGFDLSVGGYIERRYKTCSEDKKDGNNAGDADKYAADQCWVTDNATMSLNGSGGDLIKDADDPNLWHLRNDDGSRIERRTGADNDARNGEWWVVTTSTGTQYWFGRDKLPGWTSGDTTNATWTAPVFGNHAGEPCHDDKFAESVCTQAWRWNLDYVVDPHGNTMSYWYKKDSNKYRAGTGKVKSYVRGGYLDHVSYGTRVEPNPTTGKDTVFTGHASARVDFDYGDRCLSDCGTHDAKHWPDTPWDLSCTSDTSCDVWSPTFWTTHRLKTITTGVYDVMSGKNRDVERWTLTHSFPDPEDGTRAGLWLERVEHAGLVGTTTKLPDVTFTGKAMPNRVDTVDESPPMNWRRLTDINTETGAIVHIDYLESDCVAGKSVPSSPQSNTKRCYPVRWTPPGFEEKTDYFNRYVVNEVTETDLTGGSPRVLHHYTYLGDPAWHYTDDDGLISNDGKTWSVWRGYEKVGITTGDPGAQTYTEMTFFRGMDGDHLPSGERSASVKDSRGVSVPDDDAYTGMTRETRTFLGPGGAEVSGAVYDPWKSAPTATRTIGGTTVNARFVNTEGTHSRTTLDHAPWVRTNYTKNTYDAYGAVVREDDFGDEDATGDEQCTINTLEPRNKTLWLMSLPHRIQTFAVDCAKAVAGPITEADVIGDARTYYDDHAYGAAPTKGDVTKTEQMSAYNGGSPTYAQVTRTAYDDLGRSVDSWDALDRHSGTTFTPATTGPVTQTVDTNPLGWTTTTALEPAWGQATSTVDINNLRSELKYDGLGRLLAVWQPGHRRDVDTPDVAYEYLIRTDGVNAVVTRHPNPNGKITSSYTLYDGLLRTRQTQTASPSGGRILTDTFYDAAGRAVQTYGAYYDPSGGPGVNLVKPLAAEDVPNQTRTVYDGAGRPVASIFQPKTKERWRTTTAYGGDHTDVSPPQGATATSTWSDSRGRTVQLRQYPTRTVTGTDYDHTDYTFNRKGLSESVTAPDGGKWVYGYDLRGRKTSVTDPDAGRSTMRYDAGGRLLGTTTGNGNSLTYTYDTLDRKTGLYQGTTVTSAGQLVQWDYDQSTFADGVTPVKGLLTQSSRIESGRRYVNKVVQYNNRYQSLVGSVTIPSGETGLAGTYVYGTGYNADGSVNATSIPATGDLQAETVRQTYTAYDQPLGLMSLYGNQVESSIVSDSQYDALAHTTQYTLYTGLFSGTGKRAYLSYETDATTGRINEISVHRDGAAPNTVTDQHYTYDDVGNVTQIADTPTGGGYSDIQCFTYDRDEHLAEAWTPASDDCAAAPSTGTLGGVAPYWESYRYNSSGSRKQLVDHVTAHGPATTDYVYSDDTAADPSSGQPHVLRGTTTTDDSGTRTKAYTYDKGGNTKTRPGGTGTQNLVWDAEGHLQSITDTGGTSSYLYDADGARLISRDTTGKTLYLPNQELRYTNSTGKASCTRFYSHGGATVAQRTAAGLAWLSSDHQGTQNVTLNESTQAAVIRRQTPFGTERGTAAVWPNTRGFVGGTKDQTGLTHLGAREYDPSLGRFISVDPMLETNDPEQLDGYSYAANNPIVHSDPSGMMLPPDEQPGYRPPTTTTTTTTATPQSSSGQSQHDGDSGSGQHKKKCGWSCKIKKGASSAANWVDEHKAVIAGTVVAVAVGIGCGIALGATGPVGAVACGALAGAVGNMVQYAVETTVEHKGNFSVGGLLAQGAIGAVVGGAMGGLGALAAKGISAGVSAVASRIGSRAAANVVAPAVAKAPAAVVSAASKAGFTEGAAEASAGAAESAAGGASKAASAGSRGPKGKFDPTIEVHEPPSSGWTAESRMGDAAELRNTAGMAQTTGRLRTWTGAVNLRTGQVAVACSGGGNCAETNILSHTGWDLKEVMFTRAYMYAKEGGRLVWDEMGVCNTCAGIIPEQNFPPGTLFGADFIRG